MNNIDPQTVAALLLVMRMLATVLIGMVLFKQIKNMRNLHTDYPAVRITVFLLTLVLFVGQLIPITLDAVVAFSAHQIGRGGNPDMLGVAYALNNATKDVAIGALLYFLHYRSSPPKQDPRTGI